MIISLQHLRCYFFIGQLFLGAANLWAEVNVDTAVGVTYRSDTLNWNIAASSNGGSPNILSELSWDDLEIRQLNFICEMKFDEHLLVRAIFQKGHIFNGHNQDSDYALDDRTAEFSRSNNQANNGETDDYSVALGVPLRLGSEKFRRDMRIIPFWGISRHGQDLTLTNGVQTVSNQDNLDLLDPVATVPPLGPFDGLDSSYQTKWQGPWLGLDFRYRLTPNFTVLVNGQYHWVSYYAQANWNLRTDFQHPISFVHNAQGQAWGIDAGWLYKIRPRLALWVDLSYQSWSTFYGTDRVFLKNNVAIDTRLNAVNWQSIGLGVNLFYRFGGEF